MAIKVLIKRIIQKDKIEDVLVLLKKLRIEAMNHPGYISGETLVNHYNQQSRHHNPAGHTVRERQVHHIFAFVRLYKRMMAIQVNNHVNIPGSLLLRPNFLKKG